MPRSVGPLYRASAPPAVAVLCLCDVCPHSRPLLLSSCSSPLVCECLCIGCMLFAVSSALQAHSAKICLFVNSFAVRSGICSASIEAATITQIHTAYRRARTSSSFAADSSAHTAASAQFEFLSTQHQLRLSSSFCQARPVDFWNRVRAAAVRFFRLLLCR